MTGRGLSHQLFTGDEMFSSLLHIKQGKLQGVCPKTKRLFPDLILKYLYLSVWRITKTCSVRVIGNCPNCRVNCYFSISCKCVFLWVDSHCSWCLFCCRNPCSPVSGLAWPKESFNLICEFPPGCLWKQAFLKAKHICVRKGERKTKS